MKEKLVKLINEWKSLRCMNPSVKHLLNDLDSLVNNFVSDSVADSIEESVSENQSPFMTLKKIDLSLRCNYTCDSIGKNNHPHITTDKSYLALIFGNFYISNFTITWFGFNFDNWGNSGIQLGAIDSLWEIISFPQ